jgi:hypothetical protein
MHVQRESLGSMIDCVIKWFRWVVREFVYDEEREKLSKLEKEKLIQQRDEMRVS